jgi:hypothetical protein
MFPVFKTLVGLAIDASQLTTFDASQLTSFDVAFFVATERDSVDATLESAQFCFELSSFRAPVKRAVVATLRAAETQWKIFDAAIDAALGTAFGAAK